ncbi:hypothetical protein CERSUDRAFT_79657 [Gelatoporia subvermispora B]|uniref:Uncharacterized protein n=1 Tax=Ceriporiopsis subvermispora (strain B) TaxID=914234 RepID=M2RUC2_CERS8|nr:hypothetical protein CERSUDRAFT_79657 [Gelatoporia subvermispora B]
MDEIRCSCDPFAASERAVTTGFSEPDGSVHFPLAVMSSSPGSVRLAWGIAFAEEHH